MRENGQLLFAQTRSGDILLYSVDADGVTEKHHFSFPKLLDVIKSDTSKLVLTVLMHTHLIEFFSSW